MGYILYQISYYLKLRLLSYEEDMLEQLTTFYIAETVTFCFFIIQQSINSYFRTL